MNLRILITAMVTFLVDQITKIIATIFLEAKNSIMVIKNFFYFTLCYNDGVAWGLFSNQKVFIILLSLGALLVIYHFIYCFKRNIRNDIAFGLILGGLFGNLLDRLLFGYVRDFLDFILIKYDYPVFNVADIAVVLGVILLIVAIAKGEDLSESSSKRKKHKA